MSSNSKRRRSQPAQGRALETQKATPQAASSRPTTDAHGASLPKLDNISRLGQKDYLLSKDQSIEAAGFLYEFLLTYRSFTTPAGLFSLLKRRLTPENVQGSDLALVRLRVVNIFKNWINHCPQDWATAELPALFEGVLSTAQEDAVLLKHLEPLRQLITKIRETLNSSSRTAVPKIVLPQYRVQNQLKIIKETSADILAEQFTVIDIENYEDIAPWDLIHWSRLNEADREKKCPNLYRLVDRYYEIGHFVATTIVSEPELEERVEMICKFLDIAKAANDLGNFNLMMAVYSGITHPVLKKLKSTWQRVSAERMRLLNSFIKYCDPEDNYDAMRTYIELTAAVRPCLPFLGGYIAEMSQIHSVSSDYLPSISSSGERLINYAKHRKLYNIIANIQRCEHKIPVKRRENILSAIRRLHALTTDGMKMKVADLQEGSSYDILESSSSSSQGPDLGFETVATPRYPAHDMAGNLGIDHYADRLSDSSPHELEVTGDAMSDPAVHEKQSSLGRYRHPHHHSKKKSTSPGSGGHKTEILKSHSAGTFNVSKLDDGGTASSSGDSNHLGGMRAPQVRLKTSSDGALNRKIMVRTSDMAGENPVATAAVVAAVVSGFSSKSVPGGAAGPSAGAASSSAASKRPGPSTQHSNRSIGSNVSSARNGGSSRSLVSIADLDPDELSSAEAALSPLATSIPPGSSFGSHTHLYHSGGGHLSAGASPKEIHSLLFSSTPAPTMVGTGAMLSPNHRKGDASPLYFPSIHLGADLSSPVGLTAESEDSPPTPTTTSSSPVHPNAISRSNSRTTNPSPIRRNVPSPYHSNPTSARSAGKSSNIISAANYDSSVWPPRSIPHTTSPTLLPNSNNSPLPSLFMPSSTAPISTSYRISAAELKMDSKLYGIAIELLETEEDFVHYLKILVEDGVYPLRQKIQRVAQSQSPSSQSSTPRTPQSPHQVDSNTALNEAHLRLIFSNIEALYSFHSLFLEDLHNAVRYWRAGSIGSLFSQYHHGFESYIEYTNTRHRGDQLLETLLQLPATSTLVEGGLSACRLLQRQQEVILSKTRKANLISLLHLPVHRLPRILILLKEFKVIMTESHPDLPILVDAILKLEHIAMKLPMSQEDAEQSMLQLQVLNRITGWKEKLRKLRPGRNFLGEFEVKLLIQGTNRFPKLVVLLWSDSIFFCRTKDSKNGRKKKWAVLGTLNLTHVHLTMLSAKQARRKFRDLSKEVSKTTGAESKTQISWAKHPSIMNLKYLGMEWLLSFSSAEIGENFYRQVQDATEAIVGLYLKTLRQEVSPGASESAAISTLNSKVYIFGGAFKGQWRNELWSWDMEERVWAKVPTVGESPLARTEHAMCAVGNQLYLHGGQRFGSYIDDMCMFDMETSSWCQVEFNQPEGTQHAVPSPRSGHSLTAIGTKLYLFGGQWVESLHQRHIFNDLFVFDTKTHTWSELVPTSNSYVPAPRQRHVAQVIDNKLVIFGGSGFSSDLSDISIYDPVTNTWNSCNDVYGYIPTNRALAGSAVFGKKLVIFGGCSDTRSGSTATASSTSTSDTYNDLFVFDLEAMKWSHCWVPVELMPRRGHSIVTTSRDNTLTIFCGRVVNPETGDSESTSEVLLLHGLSSIINNSQGRALKLESLREKVDKLSQFAIQHQALLTVVGSHYVTPPSSEGVKWDPLTTKSTFSLIENLGSLVYKAIHEPTQSLVAIKVLSHHDCSLEMLDIMAEEMQLLSRCRHPGLTAYHGFAPVSSELWIVSELYVGTSLDRLQQDTFTEKQVGALLVTVLESLAYLHSQNIVHKSIKASNVILNVDGRVKLTDWGLSPIWKPLNLLSPTAPVAPELNVSGGVSTGGGGGNSGSNSLDNQPQYTAATDIYDIGLMVVGLLEPFGPARQLRTRHRFSAEVLDFVALCTASFAHRRPTAVQLLSHPFILPQLQNQQRDDILRALYTEATHKRLSKRTPSGSSTTAYGYGNGTGYAGFGPHSSSYGAAGGNGSGSVSGGDRAPLESRKSSGSVSGSIAPSRKFSQKAEEIQYLKSTIEAMKQESAAETGALQQQIVQLQTQNAGLEARLRSIEALLTKLIPATTQEN